MSQDKNNDQDKVRLYAEQWAARNPHSGPGRDEIRAALSQRREALFDKNMTDREWWGRSQPVGTIWRERENWDAFPETKTLTQQSAELDSAELDSAGQDSEEQSPSESESSASSGAASAT